jgi:hypothetical protein
MKLKPMTVAVYTGLFVAILHFMWSLMVVSGLGQLCLDWIMGLHFLNNPFVVVPFSFSVMIVLLVFTFVVGFILGWVGTICWNKMIKK